MIPRARQRWPVPDYLGPYQIQSARTFAKSRTIWVREGGAYAFLYSSRERQPAEKSSRWSRATSQRSCVIPARPSPVEHTTVGCLGAISPVYISRLHSVGAIRS